MKNLIRNDSAADENLGQQQSNQTETATATTTEQPNAQLCASRKLPSPNFRWNYFVSLGILKTNTQTKFHAIKTHMMQKKEEKNRRRNWEKNTHTALKSTDEQAQERTLKRVIYFTGNMHLSGVFFCSFLVCFFEKRNFRFFIETWIRFSFPKTRWALSSHSARNSKSFCFSK